VVSEGTSSNFIRQIIEEDLRTGRHTTIVTRFPPEPNGHLHIGHVKAIWMDFGMAEAYGGRCHLRMDDTNPLKESEDFVDAIQHDIRWLGFDWGPHFYHASDYFDQLYAWAQHLVRTGLAYVDEQTEDQIRATRGTVETPGTPGPWRDRPAEESLALLERMKRGELPDGAMVLRAKIDLAHPNMKMRDPPMYRIRNAPHHRTGSRWAIYPLYDWAHGQSDAIEGVTHSMCSLEFDVNRELYDWFLDHLPVPSRPHQYEWARLNVGYTVLSKRNLHALVNEGHVSGWDDPRMPTIAGLRRRGFTPRSLLTFVERLGVSKAANLADPAMLENAVRDDLNALAPRMMAVLDPVEVVVESWDEGATDLVDASHWPHDVPREGSRAVPFARRLFIERDDFQVEPEPGFKRLAPGRAIRLRHGYVVSHTGHDLDAEGRVVRIRLRHDPATRGGTTPATGKVWATIHWVAADHAVPIEVHLFERLFTVPEPGKDRDFRLDLNPDSLRVLTAYGEPALAKIAPGSHVQLERLGYFFADPETSRPDHPVLNRVVPLKDTWSARDRPSVPARRPGPGPGPGPGPVPAPRPLTSVGLSLVARGLSDDQAAVLESDAALRAWFDAAVAAHDSPKTIATWLLTELPRASDGRALDALPFGPPALARLAALVDAGTLTGPLARQVLAVLVTDGGSPERIAEERRLLPLTDETELRGIVDAALAAFPDKVAAYRNGRAGLFGFFVGEVMRRSDGKADPHRVRAVLEAALT
jgi:glutaminyl-tRNA synthetase